MNRSLVPKELIKLISGYSNSKNFGPPLLSNKNILALNKNNTINGLCRVFRNKQLAVESNWKNGEKHGLYKCWNEILWMEVNWKNGEKHGLCRYWHTNGKLSEESNYNYNWLDGICRKWDEHGKIQSKVFYKDGSSVDMET